MTRTRRFGTMLIAAAFLTGSAGAGASASAQAGQSHLTHATSIATVVQVAAKPKPKAYKNCKALNKVYKHGVGKKGAKDKTSGKPVKNFTVDNKTYKKNKKRDRDKDGIACEKK